MATPVQTYLMGRWMAGHSRWPGIVASLGLVVWGGRRAECGGSGLFLRVVLRIRRGIGRRFGGNRRRVTGGGLYSRESLNGSEGNGVANRYARLVFLPLTIDLRLFEPVREPDIGRPDPACLMDEPAFFDAAASNCEPLDSMADYVGLPCADPAAPSVNAGKFTGRVEIIGRARGPALSDWRFVRVGFLHGDARDVSFGTRPHHGWNGSGSLAVALPVAMHSDYAVGWINLEIDPANSPRHSFSGRP